MSFAMTVSIGVLILFVPILGGLMAVTPWLMRRNECFAVTVPADKQKDPRLVSLKRGYTKRMVAITVMCTVVVVALTVLVFAKDPNAVTNPALPVIMVLGMAAPIAVSFRLMLACRKEVRRIKEEEGWIAAAQQAVALMAEEDVPRPVSLKWNLLYIPLLLATVVLGVALYPSMPDVIPMQVAFGGEVTNTMSKGLGVFLFPVGLTVFMAVIMVFCHWGILHSKKHSDPGAPVTSAFAYGMFARMQSIFLLVMGLILTGVINAGFMLSAAGIISLEAMVVAIMLLSLVIVVACIILSVVYGQAGSKLHARMQKSDSGVVFAADDDEHWILGIIYYNPDDASLFLPERFGIGWTVNMARPAAWGFIAGLVLLTIAFIAVMVVAAEM